MLISNVVTTTSTVALTSAVALYSIPTLLSHLLILLLLFRSAIEWLHFYGGSLFNTITIVLGAYITIITSISSTKAYYWFPVASQLVIISSFSIICACYLRNQPAISSSNSNVQINEQYIPLS